LFKLGPTPYHRGYYLKKLYTKNQERIDPANRKWELWRQRWLVESEHPGEDDVPY